MKINVFITLTLRKGEQNKIPSHAACNYPCAYSCTLSFPSLDKIINFKQTTFIPSAKLCLSFKLLHFLCNIVYNVQRKSITETLWINLLKYGARARNSMITKCS